MPYILLCILIIIILFFRNNSSLLFIHKVEKIIQIIIRRVRHKLTSCLFSKTFSIHQK